MDKKRVAGSGKATHLGHRPECDPRALELLRCFRPLVHQIAGGLQRKLPRSVLRDDLVAAGMAGLWDAIRRCSKSPNESFEWYARVRIRGAILDELRAQDWLPRRARAAVSEDGHSLAPSVVRFDDVSDWERERCLASESAGADVVVETKDRREILLRAIDQLPPRERDIVAAHYFQGLRFKDLGGKLGVSEPRISQLHSRAMRKLKTIMANVEEAA